jgi:DNA-binding IscR family transcriptional regulator
MAPSEINLSMVMNTLDGNFSPLECITYPNDCVFAESCAQQEIWRTVAEAIQRVLSSTSLADLAQRQTLLAAQVAH